MDHTEALVERYLLRRGFTDVVFEPDGNVTPDFLVNGRIAIEVRRLDQNRQTEGGTRSLEMEAVPLGKMIGRVLKTIGRPKPGPSWFVFYSFGRPLPKLKQLEVSLREHLIQFSSDPDAASRQLQIGRNVSVRLARSSRVFDDLFVLGGSSDDDSGGFVVSEIVRNLAIAFSQKAPKVAALRHKYGEWWFVLVDYIGYGLNEDDRRQLKELVSVTGPWDRVVLISPVDPDSAVEL